MKIYTKTGDDGTTGLFSGRRVAKHSKRVDAYGTIDELGAALGIALAFSTPGELHESLVNICNKLFVLGADLATPIDDNIKYKAPRISNDDIIWLEKKIDEYTDSLPKLNKFILSGGGKMSSFIHQARAICRRAERIATELREEENLGDHALKYINRLSDYLFVAARKANNTEGVDDFIADL